MIETLAVFFIASLLGIIAGLMPGINTFVVLLILYPLLLVLEPVNIIMIYVILVSITQYFGSVSATLFAVPGEMTSVPSLYEGHELYRNNEGDRAIMYASLGSFFGSIFSVIVTLLLLNFMFIFYNIFDTRITAIILLLAVLSFIFTSQNKIYVNVILLGFGLFLGMIGYNVSTETGFLTFNSIHLYSGLPIFSVVLGIYVIPYIIENIKSNQIEIKFKKLTYSGYIETAKEMIQSKWILLRSSAIGYISGFMPSITFHAGTAIAYFVEKRRKEKNKTYKKGDLDCLLAAETANNAGAFTAIVPLLLIGIPISASQALLYNIIGDQGNVLSIEFFRNMFWQVLVAYLCTAFIGLYLAGKYVNWISILSKINLNYLYLGTIAILFIITYFAGSASFQEWYWITVTIALIPLGLLLKNFDKMPIVFGFLLQDQIFDAIIRLYFLYF